VLFFIFHFCAPKESKFQKSEKPKINLFDPRKILFFDHFSVSVMLCPLEAISRIFFKTIFQKTHFLKEFITSGAPYEQLS
jgi:hypothetical protein